MHSFDLSCPVPSTSVGFGSGLDSSFSQNLGKSVGVTSALLLATILGDTKNSVDGFISNVSLGSSYAWYFKLTQFETLFLGLLMLQVVILRYLEILPININNLFASDPSGRRRRKRRSPHIQSNLNSEFETRGYSTVDGNTDQLAESIFSVLRKLDDTDCLLKSLCEIQSKSLQGYSVPKETKNLMAALSMSGRRRKLAKMIKTENDIDLKDLDSELQNPISSSSGIERFEEAVLTGHDSFKQSNLCSMGQLRTNSTKIMTVCESRYKDCSMTSDDIIHYMTIISQTRIGF